MVASLGVESGYVPYTSYSAKTSYLKEYPDVIQKFTNGLQMGMEFVREHTPEEIAQVIAPQFPETDMETLTTIVKRYHEQDTWKENLIFEKESFELLQDILEDAGELSRRMPYEKACYSGICGKSSRMTEICDFDIDTFFSCDTIK